MKFSVRNIGPIASAEISPAPLTVICGENNTGKTYMSYTYFGLVHFMRDAMKFPVADDMIEKLIETGAIKIPLDVTQEKIDELMEYAKTGVEKFLPVVFGAPPSHFYDAEVKAKVFVDELMFVDSFDLKLTSGEKLSLIIHKEAASEELDVTLLLDETNEMNITALKNILRENIGKALKTIYFEKIFPSTMFASAERTGTLMFRDDLTPGRRGSELREYLKKEYEDIDLMVSDISANIYPLPVVKNIGFMKQLRGISLKESVLARDYPEILSAFDRISGGVYTVDDKGVYFTPSDAGNVNLAMEESSSSVRSLVSLSFWMRHLARKEYLLMIDEPEMNLHPKSQRLLARWIAMLVNAGVRVFVTTHSDYFVKELNTLIMLNYKRESEHIGEIMKAEGILPSMLISPDKMKVYVATRERVYDQSGYTSLGKTTITEAPVDVFYGAAVSSFDDTINRINQLQEAIIFNG